MPRCFVSMGAAGPGRDPRTMAGLAALAEDSGWDGVFVEDYLVYQGIDGVPTYDPWVVLSAMAVATTRIRLGTMVTPLPRRRPWKLASEAVTLDHLSGGRLVLGVGAGDGGESSFRAAGEPTEPRVLAERLDEGLEILAALWTGEPVTRRGTHYRVEGLRLAPGPAQRPRIPIWAGGRWPAARVRARLVRWDGCIPYKRPAGTSRDQPLTAEDVRGIRALAERERGTADGFEICIGGRERDADAERERDHIRSILEAGATSWLEWVSPGDPDRTRQAIARGPIRP